MDVTRDDPVKDSLGELRQSESFARRVFLHRDPVPVEVGLRVDTRSSEEVARVNARPMPLSDVDQGATGHRFGSVLRSQELDMDLLGAKLLRELQPMVPIHHVGFAVARVTPYVEYASEVGIPRLHTLERLSVVPALPLVLSLY